MFSFVLLGGFLLLSALRFGVPDMVSDTYYQLQGCKGSGKKNLNYGAVFTAVMILSGGLMMVCVLDTGPRVRGDGDGGDDPELPRERGQGRS